MRESHSGKRSIPVDEAVGRYEKLYPVYREFTGRIAQLLERLLQEKDIAVHAVESRVKSIESFRDKASLPEKEYADPLREITDLAGLRIIVYRLQDIDRIAQLIEEEFEVLKRASAGDDTACEPDRFGYRSVHLDVRLHRKRAELMEWSGMEDLCAEVQVRTVLQHAWAAVSHAVEYKRGGGLTDAARHRLVRLAGMLEIADEEFSSISADIFEPEPRVKTRPMDGAGGEIEG